MTIHKYIHPQVFITEDGSCLSSLEIVYHTAGTYIDGKSRVIWICHALTANSDPEDWWPEMVGRGKFYDPDHDFIICANFIGSCYGTTGPLSDNPDTGVPYYNDFPLITVRDMVQAHEILRKYLNIDKIHTLIGSSIGAFQCLEWSILSPDAFENLIFIASACKVSPWATAFNESQRMAIRSDKTFFENRPDGGLEGMKTARSIALLSYRSYSGYDATQQETDPDFIEAYNASSYQRYQGDKLAKRFNAYSYYLLTRTIDTHNIGRHRGGIEQALKGVKAQTLIIAISSDVLFPPGDMEFIHKHMPSSQYRCINSAFGHDGFLIEVDQLQHIITTFYQKITES